MKKNDAAKILGIEGSITPEIVATAYKRAAMKFHPDRNPAGLEMMKAINEARDTLKDFTGDTEQGPSNYAAELNDALNIAVELYGCKIEVCGSWVYVTGDTRAHKDTLKEAGFRWASKKLAWYFRPDDWKSANRGRWSMDRIRDTHGSVNVPGRQQGRVNQ